MGLLKKFLNQTRKPEGTLGRLMLRGMNSGHAQLAAWAISQLPEIPATRIVDLGCGGGKNIAELSEKYPEAQLDGVDYSSLAVEKSKKYNKALIAAGRCTVQEGDVSALSLSDGVFDLVTAFETVYFWPGLETCFAEVYRVLKPGGYFMICNELDGLDEGGQKYEKIITGLKIYKQEELTTVLKKVGFSQAESNHHGSKPWFVILAQK